MAEEGDQVGFSFPKLPPPEKLPLTARSTVTHAGSGASLDKAQGVGSAGGAVRNKVALEKGFSQVDWMRLAAKSAPAGGAVRREVSTEELSRHRSADDAWLALNSRVYDVTQYLRFHPGGIAVLLKAAGRDATPLFNKYHPWVNAHALLERFLVGVLQAPVVAKPAAREAAPRAGADAGA